MMHEIPAERLERLRLRLQGWASRMERTGLGSVLGGLLGAVAPLGPLGAGLLWIAQPAIGLVTSAAGRDMVGDLARLLSDPHGIAWLRETLSGIADSDVDG